MRITFKNHFVFVRKIRYDLHLHCRPKSFEANLKLWLKRVTHETDEVRNKALMYLQKFLAEHRSQLNEMILSETDIHPLIVDVCSSFKMIQTLIMHNNYC